MVTTGEMFPTQRLLDDEVKSTEMVGVEHLGEYVYEMTKAKIEALKASGQGMPAVEQTMEVMELDEADDVMELDDEDDAQSEELDDVL